MNQRYHTRPGAAPIHRSAGGKNVLYLGNQEFDELRRRLAALRGEQEITTDTITLSTAEFRFLLGAEPGGGSVEIRGAAARPRM